METENTDNTQNAENSDDSGVGGGENLRADRRPIGYWLRTVDSYITREFARAFDDAGVSRRDWMLLNLISGDVEAPGFAERLARKGKRLRGLEQRGWVEEAGDGTWTLTDDGRAAKERLGAVVDGIRTRVAGAVSPEDFATTLASLEAIARELGWDENERGPWAGFGRGFGGGFRPGFGRGFGEGFGRGFGEGFGPGFGAGFGSRGFGPGARRGFSEGFGPDAMHDHADHPHHHRGHGHPGHHGDHGDCHAHGGHGHGHPGREGHGRGQGRDRHDAERAYERGFDAGYTRGQSAS
ncbi:hypothetical protein [Microbacterium pumilum]|uniref:HTH marR-type domain-containing protein n=1 Tax=Microbacterium pumilum TaxID=344165 RepID=A0ABP5D9P0_9MICO